MADWPGTKTRDNPYWFMRMVGGDVSTLLGLINAQENRVVIQSGLGTTRSVAVNSSKLFVRVGGSIVTTDLTPNYDISGTFPLEGMTLNGTHVSETWMGIGSGNSLYTYGAVYEAKEPAGESVWHIGVNRYAESGFIGFWGANFTVGREDIDPEFDDYRSFVSMSVGGTGSSYVWVGFRRVTVDTPQFSSPSFNTWLRKYSSGGGFIEEYVTGALRDGRSSSSFWAPMRGADNEMLISRRSFGGGTSSHIYDEDINDVEATGCSPITEFSGGGLYILNSNQDYARIEDDVSTHNSFVEGQGVCENMANIGTQVGGIASRDATSDKRLYIASGADNEVTVYNYATGESQATIEFFQYTPYGLTSWSRFPTDLWSDRVSVGTFPEATVFDGILEAVGLPTSIPVSATILQGREALLDLIPHFRNGTTGDPWEFNEMLHDANNIYVKAMAAGVAAGRDYGENLEFQATWWHEHHKDESTGNLRLSSGSGIKALDFGEIFEVVTLLKNSTPLVEQL